MPQEQPNTQETIQKRRDFVPKLMELNEKVLFGDIWERPGLSKRDRSLITVALGETGTFLKTRRSLAKNSLRSALSPAST